MELGTVSNLADWIALCTLMALAAVGFWRVAGWWTRQIDRAAAWVARRARERARGGHG